MKKLLIISILLISLLTSFGQVFQTHDEWVKYVNHHQAIGLIINPGRLGLGLTYISKPIIGQASLMPIISTGVFYPTNETKPVRSYEIGIGLSQPIQNFSIDLIPVFNTIDEKYFEISKVSMEIGFNFYILKNDYLVFLINPFSFQVKPLENIDLKLAYCRAF